MRFSNDQYQWMATWLTINRSGNQAYGKNLRIQMGRCPVRSIFPQALEMLKKKQHLLGLDCRLPRTYHHMQRIC